MDKHDKVTRSYNMSQIKSKDTKIEISVRKYLFKNRLRYKKNDKSLPGCPDLVFPKYKTIIFINGCFWHAHENCNQFVSPKSNQEYWLKKLNKNKIRDRKNINLLEEAGWNVIVLWECELSNKDIESRLNLLIEEIKKK